MLTRIATAVVLIPIVLVLILRAPVPVLAVVAAVVALLTIFEFLKLTESYGVQPLRMPTYVFVGVFFLLLAINVGNEKPLLSTAMFVYCIGFAAAIAPFLALSILMLRVDLRSGYPAAAASVFAFTYIALPMGMLVQLRQQWAGAFYLLYLLLVVWAGDIFAYFVGKVDGATFDGAAYQSKEDVGGRRGFAGRERRSGVAAVSLRSAHEFRHAAGWVDPAA